MLLEVRKVKSLEPHPGGLVRISSLDDRDPKSWEQNGLVVGSSGVVQAIYFGRSLVLFQPNEMNPKPFRFTVPTKCISVVSQ